MSEVGGVVLRLEQKQKKVLEDWVRGGGGWRVGRHLPRHVPSEDHIKWNNSHVKAQVLLLLKEVVQDVLSDKVWV